MFEDNLCQIKGRMHSKTSKTSLFCAFIPLFRKKAWIREKINFFAIDISCWDICHLSRCQRQVKERPVSLTNMLKDYVETLAKEILIKSLWKSSLKKSNSKCPNMIWTDLRRSLLDWRMNYFFIAKAIFVQVVFQIRQGQSMCPMLMHCCCIEGIRQV